MAFGQFMPVFSPGSGFQHDPYADYVVMDLRFDNIGLTVPVDTSAFANTFIGGSVISTVASPKMMGKGAGLFSGTGNQAQSQGSILRWIPGDFTIEFWQYCTVRKGSDACILDLRTITDNYEPYLVLYNAGGLALCVQNNVRMSTPATPLNQWNHISFSRLGGLWSLYLNGVRVNVNYTNTTGFGEGRLTLGTYMDQWNFNAAYHYNGLIDNLRIWNGVSIRGGVANFVPPKKPYAKLPTSSILTGGAQFVSALNTGLYYGYYRPTVANTGAGKGTYTGTFMEGYELDIIEGYNQAGFIWSAVATLDNRTWKDYLKIMGRGASRGMSLIVDGGTEAIHLNAPTFNTSTGRIAWNTTGSASNTVGNALFKTGRTVNIVPR